MNIDNVKNLSKKIFFKFFFQNLCLFLISILILILLNLNQKTNKIKLLNKEIIEKNKLIENLYDNNNKLFSYLNPSKYKTIQHWIQKLKKKNINIKNPKFFYEKINWLICFDNIPLKTKCADKIEVCEFAKKKLGIDLCVPKIKIYEKPEDINFNLLPNNFVIKTNHGTGINCLEIVIDKSKINENKIIKKFKNALKLNLSKSEPHYLDIKPKLFIETFIGDPLKGLNDYKFYCFHGKVKFFDIMSNRFRKNYHINSYDINNKFINLRLKKNEKIPEKLDDIPENIELMKEYAEKLSKDFKFVRVDFYNVNKKIYLGEMTFSPRAGVRFYEEDSKELYIGNFLDLKKNVENLEDYSNENLINLNITDYKIPISNFK